MIATRTSNRIQNAEASPEMDWRTLAGAGEGYVVLPTAIVCPRSSAQPLSVSPLTEMAKMFVRGTSVDGWPSPSSTSW
jgi:hypothetical protein